MKIKFAQGIEITREQMHDLHAIMKEPDCGWDKEFYADYAKQLRNGVYEVAAQGQHGTYTYRVNTHWNLITLKKVERA